MTKMAIAAMVVWTAGVASAAGLVHTLRKPPVAARAAEPSEPRPEAAPPNVDRFKVPAPLTLPAQIQVLPAQIRSQLHVPVKKPQSKVPRLRCSGWKPLASGPVGQGVRYCQ